MDRLTRKQAHAQTQQRLIDAAHGLFMTDGYNATSLDAVAAEAGYSKGAVYSNFATKHDLGLAVLDQLNLERGQALEAAVTGAGSTEEWIDAFGRWAEENVGDVGWTALVVEFATSTRHVDGIRRELATRRRTITDTIAELLEQQAGALDITLPTPAQDVAVQLLALGIGLGVQRALDPDLPVTTLVDLLRGIIARSV